MLVLSLTLIPAPAYGFHSNLIPTASTILDSLCAIASVTTAIKFILYVRPKDPWTVYNDEQKEQLKPIHSALTNNIIDPKIAGEHILDMCLFLGGGRNHMW